LVFLERRNTGSLGKINSFSKANHRGYKYLLLGKIEIPESNPVLTVVSDGSNEEAIKIKI
jgi:hypothetical protein